MRTRRRKGPVSADRPSPTTTSTPANYGTDSSRSPAPTALVAGSEPVTDGALMLGTTVLVDFVDGEPIVKAAAGELLFGIPAAELTARMTAGMVYGSEPFPTEWTRIAARRAAEARTAMGDNGIVAALRYWAREELGMELTIGAGQ